MWEIVPLAHQFFSWVNLVWMVEVVLLSLTIEVWRTIFVPLDRGFYIGVATYFIKVLYYNHKLFYKIFTKCWYV